VTAVFVGWALAALVLAVAAAALGRGIGRGLLGICIDMRGRYSLSQLQLVLWTLVVIPLIAGAFIGRLLDDAGTAFDFDIPGELLAVLGISVGSGVGALVIKNDKNDRRPDEVGATLVPTDLADAGGTVATRRTGGNAATVRTITITAAPGVHGAGEPGEPVSASRFDFGLAEPGEPGETVVEARPRFRQVFLVEEGDQVDRLIDIGKFQNFWFTILAVVGYLALAIADLADLDDASELESLPNFDAGLIALIAISHAGYLAAKIPDRTGTAYVPGLSVPFGTRRRALANAPAKSR
jgi:hypothetical protein